MAAVHEKKMTLPPEQAIGVLDDDCICQRWTRNAYSNDAGRRIVPMEKEMLLDRRLSSLHEQKTFGDVGRLPTSRVAIIRVRQVLPGHKCGTVIGSTCRRTSYSTMWERCFLIGGVSILGGSAIGILCGRKVASVLRAEDSSIGRHGTAKLTFYQTPCPEKDIAAMATLNQGAGKL